MPRLLGAIAAATSRAARRAWSVVVRNRFTIAIASLVWLLWRSGTQPRRLAYPCQQAAAANLGVLAILFIPAAARRRRARLGFATGRPATVAAGSLALAGVLFLLISAGVAVFSDYGDNYVPGSPATLPWTPADLSQATAMSPHILVPNNQEAVVAVKRNPSTTYGTEPYGPGANTAYELAWQSVADLHLGPPENPLAGLVEDVDGDGVVEVIVKANHVQYFPDDGPDRNPVYVHPAMYRPLVDMLALAGADRIRIGDASASTGNYYLSAGGLADQVGLTESYVSQLQNAANNLPGVDQTVSVQRVDLNNIGHWSWVNLGAHAGQAGASSYCGSGYSDGDLAKAHESGTYFDTPDTHGRPGPGKLNSMGWLAISDYVLEADLVIDLAKLKVHYYGVNTAAIKNWVGITMLSTYDGTFRGWCRIAHEPADLTSYKKTFGNDIMWRDLVDAHRSVLYWRDGVVHATPQRRLLCVMDAINCAERYHAPDVPWPYWLHTVLASVDPVAIDAVGSRLQRYDFRNIPLINNAHAASIGSTWAIGTADPGKLRVVGGTAIDDGYNHQFLFDMRHGTSWSDWPATVVNDLTPPVIDIATARSLGDATCRIYAEIQNAHAAFYYYGDVGAGTPNVVRLGRDGDRFEATVAGNALGGVIVAQDACFNTATAQVANMPAIRLSTHAFAHTFERGDQPEDDTFTVQNVGEGVLAYHVEVVGSPEWFHVDPTDGTSAGEEDVINLLYDISSLMAGEHAATVRVTADDAANSPQDVTVTVMMKTVLPDLDHDWDVDLSDFGILQNCLNTAGVPATDPACEACDFNGDTYVGLPDVTIMLGCMSGARVQANRACDDAWE